MKKRVKSVLIAALLPLGIVGAKAQDTQLGLGWEFNHQEDNFSFENYLNFRSPDLSLKGSLVSKDNFQSGEYGISANAKEFNQSFGKFRSQSNLTYFNGTQKARDNDFYGGLRLERIKDSTIAEFFGGAKIKKLFLSGSDTIDHGFESKAYIELNGKTIGIANQKNEGIESSGVYYAKGDWAYQLNLNNDNLGYKISLDNFLSMGGELLPAEMGKMNAELGYGKESGSIASVGYRLSEKLGLLESVYLGVEYIENTNKGAIIDNRFRLRNGEKGKNPMQIRLRYETGTNRVNAGFDFRY